jgi:heat shock protein HslJ
MRVLLCLGFAALAISVVPVAVSGAAAAGGPELTGHVWSLTSLAGKPVSRTFVTMRLARGQMTGSVSCNAYSARYTARPGTFRVRGNVATTLVACPDDDVGQGTRFFDMLRAVRRYAVHGDELTFRSGTGKELATFEVQSQALPGTSWRVTSVRNQSVLLDTRLTAVFGRNGRISGSAGCNAFGATFTARAPRLSFGPIVATKKACAAPAGVMAQESQYLAALESVASYSIEGSRLELLGADGTPEVGLAPG